LFNTKSHTIKEPYGNMSMKYMAWDGWLFILAWSGSFHPPFWCRIFQSWIFSRPDD